MESRLQGKRLSLRSFEGGDQYQGWLLRVSGENWVVSLSNGLPQVGSKVSVTVHGDKQEHYSQANVVLVQDTTVILSLLQPVTTRTANCDGRTLVQRLPAVWNSPEGPVNVWITDTSRSGFGYECDRELPQGRPIDFSVAIRGQFQDVKGEVVHQRLDGQRYRGGVRLVYSTRLMQTMWSSVH